MQYTTVTLVYRGEKRDPKSRSLYTKSGSSSSFSRQKPLGFSLEVVVTCVYHNKEDYVNKNQIMDLRLLILLLFTLCSAQNSPRDYFKNCLVFQDQSGQQSFKAPLASAPKTEKKKRPCRSYQCLMQSETLDLEKLKFFQCTSDYECANDVSGMICSNHSIASEQKYCSCPYGYAYSTQNCRCQRAELCWSNQVIMRHF